MSERLSLRDFQKSLSDRVATAQRGETTEALLGIESGQDDTPGGRNWLLDLSDSGEVIPVPALTPAPLTQAWFAGLANVRGTLYAVTDFSHWRGGEPTALNTQSRLVLIGARHGNNCALLVQRALGLRSREQLKMEESADHATTNETWLGSRYRDEQGTLWSQLNISSLLMDARYLTIER